MLTLTIAEIKDLAECAGLVLKEGCEPDADDLETEITIIDCPKDGVKDDDDKPTHYAHVAYFDEYPEEGCYPLGEDGRLATTEKGQANAKRNERPGEARRVGVRAADGAMPSLRQLQHEAADADFDGDHRRRNNAAIAGQVGAHHEGRHHPA